MTPTEYRSEIASVGLSQRKAAKVLGINERTSRKYAASGVPTKLSAWVRETLDNYSHSAAFAEMSRDLEGEDDDQ